MATPEADAYSAPTGTTTVYIGITAPVASAQVRQLTAGAAHTLAAIDPANDPTLNPNYGQPYLSGGLGPWASTPPNGTGPYPFATTMDDSSVVINETTGEIIYGAGSGHVASGHGGVWVIDTVAESVRWALKPVPQDAAMSIPGGPLTKTALEASYSSAQIDSTWMEWKRDYSGFGSFAAPAGEIEPLQRHSFMSNVWIPGYAVGNVKGAYMDTMTPQGAWSSPSGVDFGAGGHWWDCDTEKWSRNANQLTSGTRINGSAVYVNGYVFAANKGSAAGTNTIDRFHVASRTWLAPLVVGAFTVLGFAPRWMIHKQSGLLLHLLPARSDGTLDSATGTRWRMFAIPYAALVGGTTGTAWAEITLTADEWPVDTQTGSGRTGLIQGNSLAMAHTGWAYAINGVDQSTRLFVMKPPAGASAQADYLNGNWHISVEAMQPLRSRLKGTPGRTEELLGNLVCDNARGRLLYVQKDINEPVQEIKPVGLPAIGSVTGTSPTNKYRFQQPLLMQRAWALKERIKYTNHLGAVVDTGIDHYLDGTSFSNHRYGPTSSMLCSTSYWPWENPDVGDWMGADGQRQSPTPWGTVSIPSSALVSNVPSVHSINVTSAFNRINTDKHWMTFILRVTTGTTNLYVTGSLLPNNTTLEVTYTDGSQEILQPWVIASLLGSTTYGTNAMADQVIMSPSKNGVLEFFRPADQNKVASSAVIKLRVANAVVVSATTVVGAYILTTTIPDTTPIPGIASSYTRDAGIQAHANYIVTNGVVTDSTVIDDVLDTANSGNYAAPYNPGAPPVVTQNVENMFDPTLWGTPGVGHMASVPMPSPAEMAQLLPHRNLGKFVGDTSPTKFKVVHSDDAVAISHGFAPMAPGLGAIQILMPGDNTLNGQGWADGAAGDNSSNLRLFLPRDRIGQASDCYFRMYVRLGDGWEANDGDFTFHTMTGFAGLRKFPEETGSVFAAPGYGGYRASDRSGKHVGGLGHQTRGTMYQGYVDPLRVTSTATKVTRVDGGGAVTSGTCGYSGRFAFRQGVHKENFPGPAIGGATFDVSVYDNQAIEHSIPSQRPAMALWTASWQSGSGRYGGIGHMYPQKWYCLELRFKLNTIVEYVEPPVGTDYREAGFLIDGKYEFWIDGIKAGMSPNFALRSGRMIDWAIQQANGQPFGGAPGVETKRPYTNVPAADYLGVGELVFNTYYGGKTPNPRDKYMWVNGIVVANNYIGPMAGVSRENGGLGI